MTAAELLAAYAKGERSFQDADLRDADLRGADLRGANLRRADLRDADLRRAYLRDADLRGANLRRAGLRGANLQGAYLGDQWIILGATRSDGYQFILSNFKGEGVRLRAGCRDFNMPQAYAHWINTRGGTKLGDETIDILDNLWSLAFRRGYLDASGNWINEHKPEA